MIVPNYPDCTSFLIYSKWPPIKVRENVTSPASNQVVQGGEMLVVPKNPRKSLLTLSLTPKSPNGHLPEWVSPFRDVSPQRGYPSYRDVSPQRRVSSLPWCQPTEGYPPFLTSGHGGEYPPFMTSAIRGVIAPTIMCNFSSSVNSFQMEQEKPYGYLVIT